jgi:hypothetical protein
MASSQVFVEEFTTICRNFYDSCQNSEPIKIYQHLLTLFDSCVAKDGQVWLNLTREDLQLPHPSTSAYSDLIALYQSIGFDAAGKMLYPETYVQYCQIKNEMRKQAHEEGQRKRLENLYAKLSESHKSIGSAPERMSLLDTFLFNHTTTGAGAFVLGLEQFVYQQSRTDETVEWKIESFQFVETGIRQFETAAVKLLKELQCDHRIDGNEIIWTLNLTRLECLQIELKLYSFAKPFRKHVRGSGHIFVTKSKRTLVEPYDLGSYITWIGGYVQSTILRSLFV